MNSNTLLRDNVRLLKGRNKIVYKFFADESFDSFFNKQGLCLRAKGKDALEFCQSAGADHAPMYTLCDIFGIDYGPEFESVFGKAAYGKGGEYKNITQLNSSALAALLCFYNVSENNPIKVKVTTHDGSKMLTLNRVEFEKENPVYKLPSCIDVALYGSDGEKDCVLLLESKFSEYLKQGQCKAGKSYKKDYERIIQKAGKQEIQKEYFAIQDNGETIIQGNHYCEGVKQMVSHYVGATKSEELKKGYNVYLGTILFDFSAKVKEAKDLLDDYKGCYSDISRILNEVETERIPSGNRVRLVKEAWTYQEFFNGEIEFQLNGKVKQFYGL